MKHLVLTLLVVLTVACTCDEQADPQAVRPSTLAGSWQFSSGPISGSFTISDYDGVMVVDNNPYGEISINGVSYQVATKREISFGKAGYITYMSMICSGQSITLHEAEYNAAYTEIIAVVYSYYDGQTAHSDGPPFTIRRVE